MGKKVNHKVIVRLAENNANKRLTEHIVWLLAREPGVNTRPLVYLCIGSDRYTGDALGPLVGSYLEEHGVGNIYGSLDNPVHAGNLVDTIDEIAKKYNNPLIIAVDACLGKLGEVGNVEAWSGGIEAGIAVGNRLPCVGDVAVIGVVNTGGQMGYLDLHSTPLSIVVKLSKVISISLLAVHKCLRSSDAAACFAVPNGEIIRPT
ncbi:MAG: putative sporulation protein YyaC [Firmicutes bacterium]|nr:putative sporulation protein YyaC [Bacillota bacterium]